ncbi:hypothetical protein H310_09278 [Aphanomyces invadans]|uniref:Uncharacterized protein n=1 Tax=Aphanomyces invadans TaxID=157072 RepID=A0A024TVD0_9STRA|nr:hypothetical protein H310_09278 [Aphanomyces invadans]ETV97973.1 hypothetical protein H310_09278 [Aphanomyces invadans]|eukprot:XP_008873534.1 hypothetical protein H310_09278 [Aphanomyces invadans]
MTTPLKLRNFTDEEDILLLRQALAGREGFGRPDFDAKKANNRFNALIEAHRKSNQESSRASGISEEVIKKVMLLNELLSTLDDAKEEEVQRIASMKNLQEHNENLSSIVREEAMQSLGKRKVDPDDDVVSRGGGGKMMKVMAMMHEQARSDLEFQR